MKSTIWTLFDDHQPTEEDYYLVIYICNEKDKDGNTKLELREGVAIWINDTDYGGGWYDADDVFEPFFDDVYAWAEYPNWYEVYEEFEKENNQ